MNFLKNNLQKRVFPNVSLSNLENVQRYLRTDRSRDCIFRESAALILKISPFGTNHYAAIYTKKVPKKASQLNQGSKEVPHSRK